MMPGMARLIMRRCREQSSSTLYTPVFLTFQANSVTGSTIFGIENFASSYIYDLWLHWHTWTSSQKAIYHKCKTSQNYNIGNQDNRFHDRTLIHVFIPES